MRMTPERWERTSNYLTEVFGAQDEFLAGLGARAAAAGLPAISVSADVGRMLTMLTRMAGPDGRGARLAIEVGTLGGYSGIWIARGLAPQGRLITIEYEAKHASFARASFDGAGVGEQVEIRRGAALDVLPELAAELVKAHGPAPVDLVFLDAVKSEYPDYFRLVRPLIRVGGLVVADNALGAGWWIDDPAGVDSPDGRSRDGADRFNRLVASDSGFEAVCVPLRHGLVIARRVR